VAVAVVRGGEVVYATGVGAGWDGASITAETPFMISSLSKAVTGLAVMRLVESGAFALDAPISRYLPDLVLGTTPAQQQSARSITIRHLLHHRSGLDVATSFVDPPQDRPGCSPCLRHVPLSSTPGSTFAYTNLNYALLGRVIEGATGRRYRTVLQDEVADPLQMPSLAARRREARDDDLAPPHASLFGIPVRTSGLSLDASAAPAGLLAASVQDVGRMLAMLLGDGVAGDRRVLRPASVDTLLAPWPRHQTGYAMGWGVGFWDEERIYRHGGMLGGYSAFMALVPGRNAGVAVLANVNSGVAFPARNRLAYGVLRLATGEDPGPVLPLERFVRLLALALVLGLVARLAHHVYRWIQQGRSMQVHWSWGTGAQVLIHLAAPLLLVGLPTTYYGVSPAMMIAFQPDLGSIALLAGAALWATVPFLLWREPDSSPR